jgi:hypothetical protein
MSRHELRKRYRTLWAKFLAAKHLSRERHHLGAELVETYRALAQLARARSRR